MDELWVRVALVGGSLALAGAVAWLLDRRGRSGVRNVPAADLAPGVYFFTSATCPTCARARETLERGLGEESYTELRWEDEPSTFGAVGVSAVPAVLIVRDTGEARLFSGQPGRALSEL